MGSAPLRKYLLLGAVLFAFSSIASAVENLMVSVPRLRVYSQPSTLSPVLTVLTQGQTVQAGSNPANGFKKVLIVDSAGVKKIGYVFLSDLGKSTQKNPKPYKTAGRTYGHRRTGGGLRNHWAFGLSGGAAYDTESSRQITDTFGNSANTGTLTGISPEFGGAMLMPLNDNLSLNGYIYYKNSAMTGSYTFGVATGTINITQSFVSAGAHANYYLGDKWWVGPGLQLDWGLSAQATLTSTVFTLSTNQFVYAYAVTGYDFQVSDTIFIVPELRIGADVNASPIIIEANGVVNVLWRF